MRFVKLVPFFDLLQESPVAVIQLKEKGLISGNHLRDTIQNSGVKTVLTLMVRVNLGDDP